ncbi:MAG: sigma-70 family RNA polymerase sigma factor [Bacteroidales bacterium]|nr:sigma-70 family RNA polymerase sigma factor [Bacteroidales bacterium]
MERNEDLIDLINLCKQNDSIAQQRIFKCYKNKLFALCLRYSKSSSEAEDMLMEGWMRIFKFIDNFEINEDFNSFVFEAWIKKVMINNSINMYRTSKKYNMNEVSIEISNINTQQIFETDYMFSEEELISCVQELPKALRIIFNMSAIDEYSNKEISQELNMTPNSVKSNLYKARKALKENLDKIANKELR